MSEVRVGIRAHPTAIKDAGHTPQAGKQGKSLIPNGLGLFFVLQKLPTNSLATIIRLKGLVWQKELQEVYIKEMPGYFASSRPDVFFFVLD